LQLVERRSKQKSRKASLRSSIIGPCKQTEIGGAVAMGDANPAPQHEHFKKTYTTSDGILDRMPLFFAWNEAYRLRRYITKLGDFV
jgi:hypothetical protein